MHEITEKEKKELTTKKQTCKLQAQKKVSRIAENHSNQEPFRLDRRKY